MRIPCTSKREFAEAFARECRPHMLRQVAERYKRNKACTKYNEAAIRHAYLVEGKMAKEIAKDYGVTTRAIQQYLVKRRIRRCSTNSEK